MDLNFRRRKIERGIAGEVVNELFAALKPTMDARAHTAESLIDENKPLIVHLFGLACERHQLTAESATRVLHYLPKIAGDLERRFADLNHEVEAATEHFESMQRGPL
jgi:hypothetical protein